VKLLVKICGMRNAATVEAAVLSGADAVGFVFAESPRRVSPVDARIAAANVPGGVLRVAVMLHPDNDTWREVLDVFRPDVLQTDAADFDVLDVPPEVRRWPVLREDKLPAVIPAEFVYEGRVSGVGETVDWRQAARHARGGRMILAGGLDAANVGEAIATVRPLGVDVSSSVESEPGRKDPQKIRAFISAARAAQAGISDS